MTVTRFYLPEYYAAEAEAAMYLKRLKKRGCDAITPVLDGLKDIQPRVVELACRQPLSILYGRPGSGKTTTLRRIVQSFDLAGMQGMILTPTGKAAKRASEVLDTEATKYVHRPTCQTTYRGLEWANGEFLYNHTRTLQADYVIIEEASMLGSMNARDILSAIDPERTRVIISGDPYQLPSIEPGNFLYDIIQSDRIAKTELTKVFRTGAKSGIAHNASRMLQGNLPVKQDPETLEAFSDCYFLARGNEEETFQTIVDYIAEKIPAKLPEFNALTDIQSLSPGKKGTVGVEALNKALRERLNSGGVMACKGFKLKDKVINRRNNYTLGIVNGDVGLIQEIGTMGMVVNFGAGTGADGTGIVKIEGEALEAIQLAYSYTVHSSQGSEYPVQITPIHRCHWKNLYQNLVYTAWTRAKQLSILVGDIEALRYCVQNRVTEKRLTGLQELLGAAA